MMKKCLFLFVMLFAKVVWADDGYAKYFEIDLNQSLPKFEDLEKKYLMKNTLYDRKYDSHVTIGNVFDEAFRVTITSYGSTDKRIKNENEDELLYLINSLPKEAYQYIGPLLHQSPNMSPKILNIPGIKETKNKFPTRIAPQLQHIEDLEFLSPYLYVLLMPEAWPDSDVATDIPYKEKAYPKVKYDEKFYDELAKLVKEEDYYPDSKNREKLSESDLITFRPDKSSPLTSADVKAVISTLDGVNEFINQPMYAYKLVMAGMALDAYESDNGNVVDMGAAKDMVNPCQRLVQKAKILGFESELLRKVAKEGFGLNSWAVTCDKTIKAYRMTTMSAPLVAALRNYQQKLFEIDIENMPEVYKKSYYVVQQSMLEMYKAPINDVVEVKKNKKALVDKFKKTGFQVGGIPVATIN